MTCDFDTVFKREQSWQNSGAVGRKCYPEIVLRLYLPRPQEDTHTMEYYQVCLEHSQAKSTVKANSS